MQCLQKNELNFCTGAEAWEERTQKELAALLAEATPDQISILLRLARGIVLGPER